ncbi:LysR family transcriptional regulator, partial [Bacillus thuringiensis]|nr:LysR family transcriptional regulator [Bacillus thuringiensis]
KDIYPANKIEFVSVEAIKQCVIADLGVAVLPAIVVEKDMREGTIKELVLKETIPPIYTQIAWHKDKWMTVPLQQFIDVTREFFTTD